MLDNGNVGQLSGDTEPVDYGYDDYGRKTSMTTYRDSTGDTTTWIYEEATGLLLEKVYADGNKTTYTYTPEGQRLTRTWARGVTTTYHYDPKTADLTLIDYSDGTHNVSRTYDSRGRPSTITDGLGTRTLSYGTGSHLLADSLTGVTRTYTNGRLTGLTLGSDYGMTYGYDTYGRFGSINAQVAGTGAQTYTYSYLPNSDLLESLTSNHGLTVTRSYEPNRDVLTQVQNQFGTDIISQYDYISDELAQRTSMTTSGLAFDTSPDPVVEPGTTDYTTNNLNQYTSIQSSVSSIQLTYDLDGDLTNDGTFQYDYDAENRLISATPLDTASGLKKVEFAYDYMSRRVQKNVSEWQTDHWSLNTEHWYVYDGWNLIREQTTGGTTTTDYYVWGLDLSGTLQGAGGIGGLLSTTNNLTSKTYLYTFDANGNVGQLVDASDGSIAAHYEYDPFGNLVVITGSEADNNVFRFSTKYYDPEAGLYYYGYRYYSPELGRWPTRDPLEETGGLNLYAFVKNNPVNKTDFKGLNANEWTYGEIREWAIMSLTDFTSPPGLADAKASIGACCSRGRPCHAVDGSNATRPGDQAAWRNIVNAAGGADNTNGAEYMCVVPQGQNPADLCWYVGHCDGCCGNQRQRRQRENDLEPIGTVTVGNHGTLYFYNVPLQGWCTEEEYNSGCEEDEEENS